MASEEVVYRSHARIERIQGPIRHAYLPGVKEPLVFGVHSEIAEHYKVSPEQYPPHAATIDYLVAAVAG